MSNTVSLSKKVAEPPTIQPQFYVVSPRKFSWLFISTFGIYGMYWMYKHWSIYKQSTGDNIWPVMRAIFDIFFIRSLYKKVSAMHSPTPRNDWKFGVYYLGYLSLEVIGQVGDSLSRKDIGLPYTPFISLVLFPFLYYSAYKIQRHINYVMGDAEGLANNKITASNILWIVLGIIFWLLILSGTYLMLLKS